MSAPLLLACAILAEVGATVGLRLSNGFTRLGPALLSVCGYGVAFYLLSRVLRQLPISIVYAVWSGAGTALIAIIGLVAWGESMRPLKIASLALILLGIAGLNLTGGDA